MEESRQEGKVSLLGPLSCLRPEFISQPSCSHMLLLLACLRGPLFRLRSRLYLYLPRLIPSLLTVLSFLHKTLSSYAILIKYPTEFP